MKRAESAVMAAKATSRPAVALTPEQLARVAELSTADL
jgi:hypothetical protein